MLFKIDFEGNLSYYKELVGAKSPISEVFFKDEQGKGTLVKISEVFCFHSNMKDLISCIIRN